MKYAVDSAKMKSIDNYTIDIIKVPPLVLMERAAMEVASLVKLKTSVDERILVVCGPGNNGGDGVASGRILHMQGYQVAIFLPFERERCSVQMKAQLEIAENLGMRIISSADINEYNIIIDAMFGIGLTKPIEGRLADIINDINKGSHRVFSVDIPSGISADTGRILNTAVRADYTITFGFMKQGLLVYPGADYAGEIYVEDIGFPQEALQSVKPDTFYYTLEDLNLLPKRRNDGHKGTFGKVLVIAGSEGMSGAAYLSAKACLRAGAGMVKVLSTSNNRDIVQTIIPEALFASYDTDEDLSPALSWADVIIIGPGLGMGKKAKDLVGSVIDKKQKAPLVVDADAINILAERIAGSTVHERISMLADILPEKAVLTPHPMELSRLTGIGINEMADNLFDIANRCSYNNKLIYVIKGARTVVSFDGRKYVNTSGNNGMATAGSGDVLAGIIAGFMAQGMGPFDAAALGVYVHGLAGDAAKDKVGTYSLMAGDIIDSIHEVFKACR